MATDWWDLAGDAASWLGNTANTAANYLTNNTAPYLALSGWDYLKNQQGAENVEEDIVNAEKQGLQYLNNQTNAGINYAQNQTATGVNYLGQRTNEGIAGATNQTQAGLASLNQGINQGVAGVHGSLDPYAQFGQQGMDRYSSLLADPSSITSDPGYLFRMQQGQQALERSAAAKGGLLSGGTGIDLTKYGQDYGTAEFDKSLGRSLPMIESGLQASGQIASNVANLESTRGTTAAQMHGDLGRTIAQMRGTQGTTGADMYGNLGRTGAELYGRQGEAGMESFTRRGEAGATEEMLKMMNRRTLMEGLVGLYGGGNQQGGGAGGPAGGAGAPTLGGIIDDAKNLYSGGKDIISGAKNLIGIGGNAAAAAGALNGMGALAGTAAVGGTAAGLGMLGTGTSLTPAVLGAGNIGASAIGSGTVLGSNIGASLGAEATTAAAAGTISPFLGIGIAAMPMLIHNLEKMVKGGSVNSAKTPKLMAQLQRDQAADPSGATAKATISRLVNGGLWAGEDNGKAMIDVLDSGALSWTDPMLYGKNSTFNMFGTPGTATSQGLGHKYTAMSYGLTPTQAKDYEALQASEDLRANMRRAAEKYEEGMDTQGGPGSPWPTGGTMSAVDKARLDSYKERMTPANRSKTARNLRSQILRANPKADITKLNQFLAGAK